MDFESIDPDNIDYGQESNDGFGIEESLEAKEQALQELLEDEGIKINLARVGNKDWEWVNANLGLKPENRMHHNYSKITRLLKEILGDQFLDELL